MNRSLQRFLMVATVMGATAVFACGAATGIAGKRGDKDKKKADRASESTAAIVGDRSISIQELDEKATGALMKVRQQEFEVRSKVLEQIIDEELLNREAESRQLTPDKLIEAEVTSKATEPPQSEVDAFYEQNKGRFGAKTKEQMVPQISAMLRSQKVAGVQQEFMKSLREKYGVKVMIEPPRVDVALGDDPFKGPEDAPVTIVAFSDYQCPFCSRAETTVQQVLQKYGDKVRLVVRDFPLSFHQNAETASMGAACAGEKGKFWEMHGAMFANQAKLSATDLVDTAGGLGLDKDEFKACIDSGKYRAKIRKDMEDGQKYGVTGTPTFFINGIMLVGARGPEEFYDVIDRELALAN
jgi:protein-disulfide isomerase